jgi:hypothetical protein
MPTISLYCDNRAVISRAYSNNYYGKSRHISIWHGYIQELITNRIITIIYVKSMNNLVNSLTKGLSRDMVRKTTSGVGLKPVIKDTSNRNPTLN